MPCSIDSANYLSDNNTSACTDRFTVLTKTIRFIYLFICPLFIVNNNNIRCNRFFSKNRLTFTIIVVKLF